MPIWAPIKRWLGLIGVLAFDAYDLDLILEVALAEFRQILLLLPISDFICGIHPKCNSLFGRFRAGEAGSAFSVMNGWCLP